jgi:hypothetical protein
MSYSLLRQHLTTDVLIFCLLFTVLEFLGFVSEIFGWRWRLHRFQHLNCRVEKGATKVLRTLGLPKRRVRSCAASRV